MKPGPATSTRSDVGVAGDARRDDLGDRAGVHAGSLGAAQRDAWSPSRRWPVARALERRIGRLGERELARVDRFPDGGCDELGDGVLHGSVPFADSLRCDQQGYLMREDPGKAERAPGARCRTTPNNSLQCR